jgi:hypothetical protein
LAHRDPTASTGRGTDSTGRGAQHRVCVRSRARLWWGHGGGSERAHRLGILLAVLALGDVHDTSHLPFTSRRHLPPQAITESERGTRLHSFMSRGQLRALAGVLLDGVGCPEGRPAKAVPGGEASGRDGSEAVYGVGGAWRRTCDAVTKANAASGP